LQFIFYLRITFVQRRRSSSADVTQTTSVSMQINRHFVTTAGLANDERCLIHNLRVEKHWSGSGKKCEDVFK